MVQIIPGILSTSEEGFRKDILRYQRAEAFKSGWVHIDFMDNIFVPNKSIEPSVVAKYPISLHKEAHLMVAQPLKWVDRLVEAGFERIIFHLESEDNINGVIDYIKSKGKQVGLSIKKETSADKLSPFIDKVDVVLIMTIVAGFQGQKFIPETLNKIADIKKLNSKVLIGVDGGVSAKNVKLVVDCGVDFFIVGSFLLKGDIDENLEVLWETING